MDAQSRAWAGGAERHHGSVAEPLGGYRVALACLAAKKSKQYPGSTRWRTAPAEPASKGQTIETGSALDSLLTSSCHPWRNGVMPASVYWRMKWALRFHFQADSSWPRTNGRSFP